MKIGRRRIPEREVVDCGVRGNWDGMKMVAMEAVVES